MTEIPLINLKLTKFQQFCINIWVASISNVNGKRTHFASPNLRTPPPPPISPISRAKLTPHVEGWKGGAAAASLHPRELIGPGGGVCSREIRERTRACMGVCACVFVEAGPLIQPDYSIPAFVSCYEVECGAGATYEGVKSSMVSMGVFRRGRGQWEVQLHCASVL